jgi:hypothetical protein
MTLECKARTSLANADAKNTTFVSSAEAVTFLPFVCGSDLQERIRNVTSSSASSHRRCGVAFNLLNRGDEPTEFAVANLMFDARARAPKWNRCSLSVPSVARLVACS